MKAKLALVVILAVALTLGTVACVPVTGGGWISPEGTKINFGFTAEPNWETPCPWDAIGQFQLNDHSTKPPKRIHGTFKIFSMEELFDEGCMIYEGECRIKVKGQEDTVEDFVIMVWDEGEPGVSAEDEIEVWIDGSLAYSGVLGEVTFSFTTRLTTKTSKAA